MGKRRKHSVTRWIEDLVDDTKDLVDDMIDRVKDVEDDARGAVKDLVGDDDEEEAAASTGGADVRRISAELGVLAAALEELTAKVNALAELQATAMAATASAGAAGGGAGAAKPARV